MKNVILPALLFLLFLFCSFPGMAQNSFVPQYFSNELVVQILAEPDSSLSYNDVGIKLAASLRYFFMSYNYSMLEKYIDLVLYDEAHRNLHDIINDTLIWLDSKKFDLFRNIYTDQSRYHQFSCQPNEAYMTIRMDTTQFDQEKLRLALVLLSTGVTQVTSQSQPGPIPLPLRGYKVGAIEPNWLFAGSQPVNMITGGPGGLPAPPQAAVTSEACRIHCDSSIQPVISFTSYKELEKAITSMGSRSTPVYILDSLPDETSAELEFLEKSTLPEILLDPLSIPFFQEKYSGSDAAFSSYRNEKFNNGDLSDHGIFIAGLVNLLAPASRIRLIEVLNQHGSGSLDSLFWGLSRVLYWAKGQYPFIVNLSLTTKLFFPGPEERMKIFQENSLYPDNYPDMYLDRFIYGVRAPELFFIALRNVIQSINQCGGIIFAATGNDSNSKVHYPAGFPARYPEVISVGSSRKDGSLSSFSNLPEKNGYLVFGGEVENKLASGGMTVDGLLSVYLSKVYTAPVGIPAISNTTGWARWAGTSFSCGVMSGMMAALCNTFPVGDARFILSTASAAYGGFNVLPLRQGP